MKKLAFLALICVWSSSFAGCDGDDAEVPIDKLSAELAAAYCEWGTRCGTWESKKSCDFGTLPDFGTLLASVKAGRVSYDSKSASECLSSLRNTPCTLSSEENSSCRYVIRPLVVTGGSCSDSDECRSEDCEQNDSLCLPTKTCCLGTCTGTDLKSDLATGKNCISSHECSSQFCKQEKTIPETPGVCAPVPSINEPCESICQRGLWCDFKSETCQTIPNTGEACTDICDRLADWCSDAGKCEPRLAIGKACETEGSCVQWASCSKGRCVAKPKVGESCETEGSSDSSIDCVSSFRSVQCMNGKCTPDPDSPGCP